MRVFWTELRSEEVYSNEILMTYTKDNFKKEETFSSLTESFKSSPAGQ